eukprot:gene32971-2485_t
MFLLVLLVVVVVVLIGKATMDAAAHCVAVLCAIDVILCIRIFHVRTVFGLVFSVCG